MTGTDLTSLHANLEGAIGSGTGDNQLDTVSVDATDGNDAIVISGGSGAVTVSGLQTTVQITGAEPTDALSVDTRAGTDTTDTSGLAPNTIILAVV